jgi:hypothetical protein
MRQFIATKVLKVNGIAAPCECNENIVCAYCVQANLILQERGMEKMSCSKEEKKIQGIKKMSELTFSCNCRQYGLCMECQGNKELKEPPVLTLEQRVKLNGLRAISRELGVSPATVSSWLQKRKVPMKYFRNNELMGKEAICK